MRPKTLSASSVHVAELCLSRWKHEIYDHPARVPNQAALLGTAVHGALEQYVREVYLEKRTTGSWTLLRALYMSSFLTVFGSGDEDSPAYRDGLDLLKRWFERTPPELEKQDVEVLSVENKLTFDLPTSVGKIPFTYIMDRLDRLGPNEYRVVDYKSSFWAVSHDELKKKIQPRVYAVAAHLMYPDAERIWVEFDMLRHERVGRVFSKEDNRATWNALKASAERILATPEDDAPETINPECRFCIRVGTCESVASNTAAGGVVDMPIEEAIDRYTKLQLQSAAIRSAMSTLEGVISADAKGNNWTEKEGHEASARFSVTRRRAVDAERVMHIVPPAVWAKYGSSSITLKDFDHLMADPALKPEAKAALRGMVEMRVTAPALKVKPKEDTVDEL